MPPKLNNNNSQGKKSEAKISIPPDDAKVNKQTKNKPALQLVYTKVAKPAITKAIVATPKSVINKTAVVDDNDANSKSNQVEFVSSVHEVEWKPAVGSMHIVLFQLLMQLL